MRQDALRGFADADWATDTSNRKSQSGYVFMVYGGAVSWRSKKQPTIATSSCEAEIISLSMSMKEALWLRMLMSELKLIDPEEPTKVFEDNQGAKALVSDPKFSDRSKHIDIQFLRIREEIREKKITIYPILRDKGHASGYVHETSGTSTTVPKHPEHEDVNERRHGRTDPRHRRRDHCARVQTTPLQSLSKMARGLQSHRGGVLSKTI